MKKKPPQPKLSNPSFFSFLFKKPQRLELIICLGLFILFYFLLTYWYPYAAGISDSGAYIKAAINNKPDTYRPFGYSQFLIDIHDFSTSFSFLVFVQYFTNAFASLFFVFTVKYLFPPRKKYIFYIFLVITLFSPIVIYLTNCVLSDTLFTTLTVMWLVTGLWMVCSKKLVSQLIFLALHLFFLADLIDVRYTGLFYPVITALLVFSFFYRKKLWLAILLTLFAPFIAFSYYGSQKAKMKELTGVNTFSGFSGWQLTNNALNCASYIKIDTTKITDPEVRQFASLVSKYKTALTTPEEEPSAKFLWDTAMPMKKFLKQEIIRKQANYVIEWNYLGENVYSKFGSHIIKNYPLSFFKHYILPNSLTVFYPKHDQIFSSFNKTGMTFDVSKQWFELTDKETVYCEYDLFKYLFPLIPGYVSITWVILFLLLIAAFVYRKKIVWEYGQYVSFWFVTLFVGIYTAFSVYAGPFELRYIAPVHIAMLLLIYVLQNSLVIKNKTAAESDKNQTATQSR